MEKKRLGLTEALALKPRELIAIVGGGGKTTLMAALAEEIRCSGRRVVACTTTKIHKTEAMHYPAVIMSEAGPAWRSLLHRALEAGGWAFVGKTRGPLGKIEGISPSVADGLFQDASTDFLIVEADGAAGRPVKVPAGHEPVIPESSTLVVAVMGLEALERRFDPETVFRVDEFAAITGVRSGERLSPRTLATVFLESGGLFKGAPDSARRVVFLNKLDLLKDPRPAAALVDLLTKQAAGAGLERVVTGSLRKGEYSHIGTVS